VRKPSNHLDGLDGPVQVGGDGFLAEDVLPGFRAFFDLVRVELGGGADPDGLDVGMVDDLGREGGREEESGNEVIQARPSTD